MEKKKRKFQRRKQVKISPERKFSFLFCASSFRSEDIEHLNESIKRMKRELVGVSSFFICSDISLEDEEEKLHSSLKVLDGSEPYTELLASGSDYFFIFEASNLRHSLNLNDFVRTDHNLPPAYGYSEILFRNQPLNGVNSVLAGKSLLEYISELPQRQETGIIENIRWYIRKLHLRDRKIILEQEFPFISESSKRKLSLIHPGVLKRWFKWNFAHAFKEFKENKRSPLIKSSPLLRPAFILAAMLTLLILPVISYNAAISGDEEKHHIHAQKVYNYFKTDGQDTLALSDRKYKLNYYGQSFDLFSYVFIKAFNIEKVYETRHVLNGLAGAAAIVSAAVLVRLLAGNLAGLLTFFLLFFSPRFLGHAMNNPLDIPFALGYIFTTLQIVRFLKRLPKFSGSIAFLICLGIAFTISIRIGGLILIPYLFLFSGLYLLIKRWPWKFLSAGYLRFAGKGLIYLTLISIVAYFLSILTWPYALQAPLENPFKALDMMANISVAMRVMFEGEIIWSDRLPWHYIPKNVFLTVPLVILIFFFFPLFMGRYKRNETDPFWIFLLYFMVIFPVLYIIYKESNVYGGWRHMLFIYPAMVSLAAIGISWLITSFKPGILRIGLITVIIVGMAHPILHIFRNYPLQYIYFNEIAGGVNKAYKKYETDYYLNSLKPGTEWIVSNVLDERTSGTENKVRVISNAPFDIMDYYFRNQSGKLEIPYTRFYDRGMHDWDYAIFYCNFINPYQLKRGIWPPKNTIHEIKVDDVTVGAVVKRENRNDYLGIQKLKEGTREQDVRKITDGILLLESAVQYDPNNEIAYLNLAQGYIIIQQFDMARKHLNSLLEIYPEYDKALNFLGYSYLAEAQKDESNQLLDRGITIFTQTIKINEKYTPAYHNLGLAYMMKGDDDAALGYFNKAIDLNANYKQSYMMIATIFEKRGDAEKAYQIRRYVNGL